jgi:hypothetical protein
VWVADITFIRISEKWMYLVELKMMCPNYRGKITRFGGLLCTQKPVAIAQLSLVR